VLERDYYTLSQAAVLLGCSADDVIHQGVKGKLDIHVLLANWNVKGAKRVSGRHIEFDMFPKPLTKKLHRNCLAKFEANQETAEVMLAHEFIYTHGYRDPLAAHCEFWEYELQTSLWRYCIGDTIFFLRRSDEFYVSITEPVSVLKRYIEGGFGFPAPIKLNECAMVVMAEDLKRLQATPIDDRVSDTAHGKKTKLEKQQGAILKVINQKGFKPLEIPDCEKGTIRLICEAEHKELFDGETSFDNAWKASKHLFRMANHASYAKRSKQ